MASVAVAPSLRAPGAGSSAEIALRLSWLGSQDAPC